MQTTVEPEDVDERVVEIMAALGDKLGGVRGWEAGLLDVAALLRIAAIIGKGIGGRVEQFSAAFVQQWNELPEPGRIRAASARARGVAT